MVSWLESLELLQSILPTRPPFDTVQRMIRRPSTFSGLQPVHAHSKSSTPRLMTVIRGFLVVQVLPLGHEGQDNLREATFRRGRCQFSETGRRTAKSDQCNYFRAVLDNKTGPSIFVATCEGVIVRHIIPDHYLFLNRGGIFCRGGGGGDGVRGWMKKGKGLPK